MRQVNERQQKIRVRLSSHKPPLALEEALRLWLDGATPVAAQRVPLSKALGRVLAEDLRAQADHPMRHIALRDGHAVESAQTIGASSYSPASLLAPPAFVQAGDALPEEADALLPPDAVVALGPLAQALEEAAPGRGVRRAGEDLRAGDLLAREGEILRESAALACARAGIESAAIRAPRVAVTGAGDGAAFVAAAVLRLGGGIVAEGEAQAIVAVGVAPAVAPVVERIALRPGEAISFGRDEAGRTVLHLPDLAGECLAAALVILPALLRRLSGAADDARRGERAVLLERISSAVGMAEIVLLAREDEGVRPLAVGDLPLCAFVRADAFALVGPESEGVAAGDAVVVFPLW
jgi:molybdopterin molybdotransferase